MNKLLTTTALPLLLMSLASVSYGQVETIYYVSGDVYVGEISNGQRNGQGIYTSALGNIYEGSWVADRHEGEGTFEYFNGDVYSGEFKNGKRHGLGKIVYSNGYQYEGFWSEDSYSGEGTYTHANGVVRTGFWVRGHLVQVTDTPVTVALLKRRPQERAIELNEELSGDLDTKVLNVQDYLTRVLPLVNQGDEKAIEWLTKAAEQGSPEAQYHLGYNLARGQGIAQDEAQAEYWLTKSAEAGNIDSRQELQRSLGWTIDQVNILTIMKPRCTSFGFEEGTDGHATCVMELQIAEEALAQARELAEETQNEINQRFNEIEDARERAVAIGAAQQQAARRYEAEQQRVAEEQSRQRAFGRALMSIGAGVSSGRGIGPGSSSNSGGMYQTCNYNVLGEIVPYPISSARICPMSMDFGGVPGTLQ